MHTHGKYNGKKPIETDHHRSNQQLLSKGVHYVGVSCHFCCEFVAKDEDQKLVSRSPQYALHAIGGQSWKHSTVDHAASRPYYAAKHCSFWLLEIVSFH
jgi:hypothetical protein